MNDSLAVDSTALGSADENILATIILAILSFFVVFLIIGIIWYILNAFGLYRLAKNRNLERPWLAWIPIVQYYTIGQLIGNYNWHIGFADWILVIGNVINVILSYVLSNMVSGGSDYTTISMITSIFSIVFYCYVMTALYKLYKIYTDHPVAYLIFSIILPFLTPIFIFVIRNRQPKLEVLHAYEELR